MGRKDQGCVDSGGGGTGDLRETCFVKWAPGEEEQDRCHKSQSSEQDAR